jgi:hypothetical protein
LDPDHHIRYPTLSRVTQGAVVARMTIDDSSVCFINVHLAAGQSHKTARNADVAGILEEKAVFVAADIQQCYVNGGDGSAILDHETVFLNGDLNYRIDQRRDNVISSVHAGDLAYLLEHDQLRKEMMTNTSFRLRSFHEAPINFAPTYKYTPHSQEYDQSEKKRIPAWFVDCIFLFAVYRAVIDTFISLHAGAIESCGSPAKTNVSNAYTIKDTNPHSRITGRSLRHSS